VLDFGWAELLIIAAVAVFVIGPKDIPNMMYGLGRIVRRLQYIRFAVSQQFDDLMKSADVEELRRGVNFEQKRDIQDTNHEADEDADVVKARIVETPKEDVKQEAGHE
jgi:sec-independent protein translocase protein TatB